MLAAWRGKFWQHLVVSSVATLVLSREPGRRGRGVTGTTSLSSLPSLVESALSPEPAAVPCEMLLVERSARLDRTHQLSPGKVQALVKVFSPLHCVIPGAAGKENTQVMLRGGGWRCRRPVSRVGELCWGY